MKINFSRLLAFLTTIIFFCNFSLLSHAKSQNPLNGNWQYLIRRGDNKGAAGSLGTNPSCPFYVGYLSFDFKKVRGANQKEAYSFQDGDIQILPISTTEALHVKSGNQERRGSYTPVERNDLCRTPNTAALDEIAPIRISKVAPNFSAIEWYTDFSKGNYKQNVFWKTKAIYNSSSDEITGTLKAYMCSGQEKNSPCTVLNTTKFVAKRVKSIEEASRKPLSATFPEFKLKQGEFFSIAAQNFLFSQEYSKLFSSSYIKPSIKAVFPAFAQNSGEGSVQRAACAGGQCWCLGGANSACVKCKWVNCPGKEGQAAPATREDMYDDSKVEGRCFGASSCGRVNCNTGASSC